MAQSGAAESNTLEKIIDRLAEFEPVELPFISLYLNAQANEHGRQDFERFLRKDLQRDEVQNVKTRGARIGGWSQMRYQRHLEQYHLQHAKEVADQLEQVVREDDVQHIILAGDAVIIPKLKEQLPKAAAEKVVD